jgi:uncharacterized protein (DUF2235 family)
MHTSPKQIAGGKNIIICSDGTGNAAVKDRGTNVFKLFESIDLNGHRTDPTLIPQIAFYDDGVGTEDFKPWRIFTGATGFGLSRNVKQLYKELVRIYDQGDRIFLFGFSRGAFTVRTLAGLISTCGIIDPSNLTTSGALKSAVEGAYQFYRHNYRTALIRKFSGNSRQFKNPHPQNRKAKIAFVGVWDTVDAVGLPFYFSDFINATIYRFKFPDHRLSPIVERACHALAIDDDRHSFHPLLWDHFNPEDDERIEQVWFAGAHSNVGGGYPKQGVSLVALDWMMAKAGESGLRIHKRDREFYSDHGNVHDKIYAPRAGLGMFYRWEPRNMSKICVQSRLYPAIHLSVVERIANGTEDYAPGNIDLGARVVITPTGNSAGDEHARRNAEAAQNVLSEALGEGVPLLDRAKCWIAIGRTSYYVYLLTCIAAILSSLLLGWQTMRWILLAGGLLSLLIEAISHRHRNEIFSQFWHQQQPALRAALKNVRETASENSVNQNPSGSGLLSVSGSKP